VSGARRRVLLIGYGNPARQDDGLGPALAAAVERAGLSDVTVESGYQLSVEDAETIARHDAVIFADAATAGPEPYELRRLAPERAQSFSSHSVGPAAALAMAHEMFGAATAGFALAIRGYAFEMFVEKMTDKAAANLAAAAEWLIPALRDGSWAAAARPEAKPEGS
jgi:hydrogenase maturation protease